MQAIRVKSGAIFVSDGLFTVRLSRGVCGPSPIAYEVLEWDLRTEPPENWEYLSEGELMSLPDGGYDKIAAAFARINAALRG